MHGQGGSAAVAPPPVKLKLSTRAPPWTTAGAGLKGLRQHEEGAVERSVIQCSTYFLGFTSKTPTNDHIWPNPRFWARELGFLPVFITTFGPNFGPDVVLFSLTPPGASQKPS